MNTQAVLGPNQIAWCCQHITNFAKYMAEAKAVAAERASNPHPENTTASEKVQEQQAAPFAAFKIRAV